MMSSGSPPKPWERARGGTGIAIHMSEINAENTDNIQQQRSQHRLHSPRALRHLTRRPRPNLLLFPLGPIP